MAENELIEKIREIFNARIPERDDIFERDLTKTINDLASRNVLKSSITADNIGRLASNELKTRCAIAWENIQKLFEKHDISFTLDELAEVRKEIKQYAY